MVIKEQLLDYNRQFKRMRGSFDSFKIVYDYLNFVTSDLYLAKLLLPLVENYEHEANTLEQIDMDSFSIDLAKPGGLAQMPIFKEQYQYWQKQLDNKEQIDLRKGLPIYFASLSIGPT